MEERKEKPEKTCYICASDKYVDDHHYDCREGEISPETVPMCRRCHRTYHDLGVEWFEDEYLDRAIEIENKRRKIVYSNLKEPVIPLVLLKREDIKRSSYWNKTHNIIEPKKKKYKEPVEQLALSFAVGEGRVGRFSEPELL